MDHSEIFRYIQEGIYFGSSHVVRFTRGISDGSFPDFGVLPRWSHGVLLLRLGEWIGRCFMVLMGGFSLGEAFVLWCCDLGRILRAAGSGARLASGIASIAPFLPRNHSPPLLEW